MEEEAIEPAVEAPPRPVSRRRLYLWLSVLAVRAAGALLGAKGWGGLSRPGPPGPGGGPFFLRRTTLPVPLFRQGDAQWRADLLGPTPATIGAEGCALSSAAMVLSYYGVDTDPHRLNEFLIGNGGYTPEGWIYWEKAAELAPGRVRKEWEDPGSHKMIDLNLLHGNPVIVKLRLQSGTTHFVVIAGKQGFDYLIRDPGGGSEKGLYPLRDLGS